MEADKVRERVARQPEGCTSIASRKEQGFARSAPNFGAVDNEAESLQDLHGAVVRAHTGAATNQQHIAVKAFKRCQRLHQRFQNRGAESMSLTLPQRSRRP